MLGTPALHLLADNFILRMRTWTWTGRHAHASRSSRDLVLHLPSQSSHFVSLIPEELRRRKGKTIGTTSALLLGGNETPSHHSTASSCCSSKRGRNKTIDAVASCAVLRFGGTTATTATQCIQIGLGAIGIELKRRKGVLLRTAERSLLLL